jgi:hypothetical protein
MASGLTFGTIFVARRRFDDEAPSVGDCATAHAGSRKP